MKLLLVPITSTFRFRLGVALAVGWFTCMLAFQPWVRSPESLTGNLTHFFWVIGERTENSVTEMLWRPPQRLPSPPAGFEFERLPDAFDLLAYQAQKRSEFNPFHGTIASGFPMLILYLLPYAAAWVVRPVVSQFFTSNPEQQAAPSASQRTETDLS